MEKEKIAIWGLGSDGRAFYETIKDKYEVCVFIDNNFIEEYYYNIKVVTYDQFKEIGFKGIKIVVATSKYWNEIFKILSSDGLIENEDFTFFAFVDITAPIIDYYYLRWICNIDEKRILAYIDRVHNKRKIIIIYGNCQTFIMKKMLSTHDRMMKKYCILSIPEICTYTDDNYVKILDDSFWNYCDVFISQRISENNRFTSKAATSIIEKKLGNCKICWIPNIYFKGYWPQFIENTRNYGKVNGQGGYWPFGDKYILSMFTGGGQSLTLEQILSDDFIDCEILLKCIADSIEELMKREQKCDVIISDYIKFHFKEKQLFYSVNHPINEVIAVLLNRCLEFFNIEDKLDTNMFKDTISLKGQDIPIYPSIIKQLGLKKYEKEYYPNKYLWDFCGDSRQYLSKFIEDCFNKKS